MLRGWLTGDNGNMRDVTQVHQNTFKNIVGNQYILRLQSDSFIKTLLKYFEILYMRSKLCWATLSDKLMRDYENSRLE